MREPKDRPASQSEYKPVINGPRDPKDYPKAGDIVLPIPDSIKREAEERAKNYMALKTPPGEKKAVFDIPEIDVNTRENKAWVLKAMGFQNRGTARYWHPVLGEDLPHNHLYFDLETDDLTSLTPKLYRTGWVYGQRELRWKFKQLLDIKL